MIILIMLLGFSELPSKAEGLSSLSKTAIIKRTNPDFQEFISQYLEFSDSYSSKECIEYGLRTNQNKETLNYCNMYFKEYGLTSLSAYFLKYKLSELNCSPDVKNLFQTYLLNSKRYDIQSCIQEYKEIMDNKTKSFQLRISKESKEVCSTFFKN